MDWPSSVGIVGGGIIGLASAYVIDEQARADGVTTRITVYEKKDFGGGSTTRAGCGLRTFYACQTNMQLAKAGIRFWRNAGNLLDHDISFRENGYLFLTRDGIRAADLEKRAHRQHAAGEQAVVTDRAEAYASFVRDGVYESGVFTPNAALADPAQMVDALVETLKTRENCKLSENTKVIDPHRDGEIATSDGVQTHDVIVNAAGGWGGQFAAAVGESFPVTPQARRLACLDKQIGETDPLTVDLDSGVYVLPDTEGRALVGGYFGSDDARTVPDSEEAFTYERDAEWERRLRSELSTLAPAVADASVSESWTGLYSMTASRRPFIERTDDIVHALGFSGHGIMQAPGAAQVVASLARDEQPSLVPANRLARGRPPVRADLQF